MSTKVFNTRLQLKYDSWKNWYDNNPTLLAGEIAIVSVPAQTDESTGEVTQKPAILFKVGDGTTDFRTLDWASGLAADVYGWAKKEQGAATDVFTAENVSVEDVLASLKETLDNLEASEVAYTKKARGEGETATPAEDINVEIALDSLYDAIAALSGDSSESIADLITKVNKNTEDITSLKGLVGEEKVSDQIAGAIEDLDLANTYASKSEFETHIEEVKDYGTRISAVETLAGNAATKTALDEEIARAKAAEEANAASIKTISDDYVKSADIANFATTENVQEVADARYTKEEADAKFALITDAYDDTEVRGLISDNADAITEVSGKVDTLVGEDTGKSVRTIANEELAAQLIADNAAEALDTLQEIAAWIQSHPGDAAAMNAAIEALEAKTVLGTDTDGVEYTTIKAYVEAAIAALNIGDYAKAADLTALAGRVEILENAGHQNADQVQSAITTAIDGLDSSVEAAAITEAGEVSVLTKVVQENGKLTDKAEVKLAKVATSGKIEDLDQEAEYVIFNCGTASTLVSAPVTE